MKRIILFLVSGLICCATLTGEAKGAAYYLRADGKAAGKASATSCNSASTAMSVQTHNSQTFFPGDVIYLCGSGGRYKDSIVAPSDGKPGQPISYTGAPGQVPEIEGSTTLSDHSAAGWISLGGGLYKREKAYGQVFFEDDALLPKASTSACTDGSWYYDVIKKPWIIYYRPGRGTTPAHHKLERIWADSLTSARCLSLADRSNVEVHGLKMDKCGVGIFIGQNKPSKVSQVSGVRIYNNRVSRAYWAIWGHSYGDGVVSDVNIYDNVVSYSSYGIGCWTTRDRGKRSAGYNTRFTVTRNQVLNLDSASDTLSWNRAFGDIDELFGIDHEGISFQDVQDSEISYNLITSKVPVSGRMTPRGIYLYGSHETTARMSGNRIVYNRLEGGFHEGIYVGAASQGNWHHAGVENNVIACNVMVGDRDPFTNHNSFLVLFSEKNPAAGTNYFINNTIYNSGGSGAYGINVSGYAGNWVFRNNIIRAATNFVLGSPDAPVSSRMIIDHNLYAGNGSFFVNGIRREFAYWMMAGYDADGSRITDPLLNADGTLKPSSPAIDKGLNLGAVHGKALLPKSTWTQNVITDEQKKYGSGWEIGAYLYPGERR